MELRSWEWLSWLLWALPTSLSRSLIIRWNDWMKWWSVFTSFLSQTVLLHLVFVKHTGEPVFNCSVNYIVLLFRHLFLTLHSSYSKAIILIRVAELWSCNVLLDLCLDLFVSRFKSSLGNRMELLLQHKHTEINWSKAMNKLSSTVLIKWLIKLGLLDHPRGHMAVKFSLFLFAWMK